jgi:hypothetical protein
MFHFFVLSFFRVFVFLIKSSKHSAKLSEEAMMRMRRPWAIVFIYLLFLAGAGCGNRSLSKVEGVVTLDGSPLSGATVSFMPVGEGRAASGLTDGDGYFRLTTFRTDDGALAGDYKVVVVVDNSERIPATTDEEKKAARVGTMTPQGKKKQAEKKKHQKPQVPEIYSDIKKTPLKEVVPTNGKIELALRSAMAK